MTHKFLPAITEFLTEIVCHHFEMAAHFTFLTFCIGFLLDFSWGKSLMMPTGFVIQLLVKFFINQVFDHALSGKKPLAFLQRGS